VYTCKKSFPLNALKEKNEYNSDNIKAIKKNYKGKITTGR
jgi:hypothetical protein